MQPFYSLKYLNWYVTKTKRNLVNLAAKIDGCIEKEGGRYRHADLLVSTFVYDSVTGLALVGKRNLNMQR